MVDPFQIFFIGACLGASIGMGVGIVLVVRRLGYCPLCHRIHNKRHQEQTVIEHMKFNDCKGPYA